MDVVNSRPFADDHQMGLRRPLAEDDRHPGFASAANWTGLHIGQDFRERIVGRDLDRFDPRGGSVIPRIAEQQAGLGARLSLITFSHIHLDSKPSAARLSKRLRAEPPARFRARSLTSALAYERHIRNLKIATA